jgi:hypothetical protein
LRPLRIPSHIEDAIGEEGGERAVVIIIFADLVILETAAERPQQQDRAAKLLRGHVLLDATHEEPVEPIAADLHGGLRTRQVLVDRRCLRLNDLVGLGRRVAAYARRMRGERKRTPGLLD